MPTHQGRVVVEVCRHKLVEVCRELLAELTGCRALHLLQAVGMRAPLAKLGLVMRGRARARRRVGTLQGGLRANRERWGIHDAVRHARAEAAVVPVAAGAMVRCAVLLVPSLVADVAVIWREEPPPDPR